MKRLENAFKNKKKLFSVFLMAGYPDDETCLELMLEAADNGADFIELGMPFSDPSADGPTVKSAGSHALLNGTTTKSAMKLIKMFREKNSTTPIVWMGYFNSIFNYGIKNFFSDLENTGADGVLTVDLPPEEFHRLPQTNLDIIRLMAPTTDKERMKLILDGAAGFIYFVSVAGITGQKEAQEETIRKSVEYLKTITDVPVCIGFGIKNAQKAREMWKISDGVIVGSALLNIISQNLQDKKLMFNRVREFLKSFVIS